MTEHDLLGQRQGAAEPVPHDLELFTGVVVDAGDPFGPGFDFHAIVIASVVE